MLDCVVCRPWVVKLYGESVSDYDALITNASKFPNALAFTLRNYATYINDHFINEYCFWMNFKALFKFKLKPWSVEEQKSMQFILKVFVESYAEDEDEKELIAKIEYNLKRLNDVWQLSRKVAPHLIHQRIILNITQHSQLLKILVPSHTSE